MNAKQLLNLINKQKRQVSTTSDKFRTFYTVKINDSKDLTFAIHNDAPDWAESVAVEGNYHTSMLKNMNAVKAVLS